MTQNYSRKLMMKFGNSGQYIERDTTAYLHFGIKLKKQKLWLLQRTEL